jgi:Ca2+-binding RTX toxin-like protein
MVMQPTDGDDLIIGYASDDVLDGGAGNDTLKGGEGSDTYKFGRSSGKDFIEEGYDKSSHTDRVLLDDDVATDDVTVVRIGTGNDLRLTIADSDSELRIDNYFYQDGNSPYALEEIHFADGSVWDFTTVEGIIDEGVAAASEVSLMLNSEAPVEQPGPAGIDDFVENHSELVGNDLLDTLLF